MMYASIDEINKIKERFNLYISKAEESTFSEDTDRLLKEYEIIDDAQNKIKNLKNNISVLAINALLTYLNDTQKQDLII